MAGPAEQLVALFERDLRTGDALAGEVDLAFDPPRDGSFIPDAAASLRRELIRRVQAKHQFVVVEPSDLATVEGIYAESLRDAAAALAHDDRDARLRDVLVAHRTRVDRVLEAISSRQPHGVGPEVRASEYSPELQLAVLGFETRPLPEPVLDLGCGREAQLVSFLRARGVDAVGLDRDVPAERGIEGDWLETSLSPGSYGAILSHLGYSLHFLHHHLGSEAMAARYATRMLAILRAVRAGGVFAYAPGLPFFEPLLSEAGYRIVRVKLPEEIRRSVPKELAERVGQDVAYGCQVWRRS